MFTTQRGGGHGVMIRVTQVGRESSTELMRVCLPPIEKIFQFCSILLYFELSYLSRGSFVNSLSIFTMQE